MDLEGFDDPIQCSNLDTSEALSFRNIVEAVDKEWYIKASRSARWMDLLGDYAGNEPFIIDGDALFQIILDDPLLSIGRKDSTDCSFQILHAYYLLETMLGDYHRRSANIQIVFWHKRRHLSIDTGGARSRFIVASRALARSMLFRHLSKLRFAIHMFDDLNDPSWVRYAAMNKPMFIMTNDGGLCDEGSSHLTNAAILSQRVFLLGILTSTNGIAVALLKGAEYRDSKILSFVYEPSQNIHRLLKMVDPLSRVADRELQLYLSQQLQNADLILRFSDGPIYGEDIQANLFQELNIVSSMTREVPAEVVYLFIAHALLVPTLSVHDRAQLHQCLNPQLTNIIRQKFLPPLFLKAANLLASHDYPLEVDGTIFVALVIFIILEEGQLPSAIGSSLYSEAQTIWSVLGGSRLDFKAFAARYPLPDTPESYTQVRHKVIEPSPLLEFSNPIFDKEFSALQVPAGLPDTDLPPSRFATGINFSDTRHWHNEKPILASHQGGSKPKPMDGRAKFRKLRSDQRFMATLQVQAATLTGASGASLRQIVIPPVGSAKALKQSSERPRVTPSSKKEKAPILSSKDKLLMKIKEEKHAKQKDSSQTKWKQYLSTIAGMSLADKSTSMTMFARNQKADAPDVLLEMQLFRLHLELELWIEEPARDSAPIRDRYTVSIMRMVKDISQANILTLSAQKVLTGVLLALGFHEYVSDMFSAAHYLEDQRLSFSFVKLLESKSKVARYSFMSITEHPVIWQLRVFGEYMDRSMDGSPDKRVSFEPDAWQRRVLDGIDQDKSLLVIAPTSAGKTFISYYAMEKVLRESDEGILVYVAPTKALVTQIAAEVYARFSKNLSGRSCWAIHTRDFRIHNPQTCQILVTVPEMLAIMLLSPPLAKVWTPRIKRIILDEIHSIGQQEGGAVWEQIILFSPCPIIGLSATIGSPDTFSSWLQSVQEAHGFRYELIEHCHRYSHLRKFFYQIDGSGTFTSLDQYQPTNRAKFLHPISLLSFGPSALPSDLSLEAADTLTLFNALFEVQPWTTSDRVDELKCLEPQTFFSNVSGFLRQKDVLDYETRLKEIIIGLMKSGDPRDRSSPLGRIIHIIQDPTMADIPENTMPSPSAFQNDLSVLLADLYIKNGLPAILFNFDRSNCELMAQDLVETLERTEEEWRSNNPKWIQKIKQWELWKDQSKARERASERLKRQKKREDRNDHDGDSGIFDPSWQSSFNPGEPSPEFSFVGNRSLYSKSDLEKDIRDLGWTSTPQWAFKALKRGIAVHHAGMNKHYRSLVESLYRQGFVQVVIATGTLALGINAPTKTSVFCGDSPYLTALMYRQCSGRAGRRGFDVRGNVVFYGLPLDRVRRLTLSRLPTIGGNFPITSTMTLRLFNLLDGSGNSDFSKTAIRSLMGLTQITLHSEIGREQLLHHLRFSIEYLRRSGLLDKTGKPINLFALAAHLYYTEPSNFALVTLMRSGVLHSICNQPNEEVAKKDFMVVMCNLFGRRYLSKIFAKEENVEELASKYPSMIILPPLPESARRVLVHHEEEILCTFKGYASAYAKQYAAKIGSDNILPLSRLPFSGSRDKNSSRFYTHLAKTAIPVLIRSSFVANSGHDDSFKSVLELTNTSRTGLNLNGHAIPSMSHLIPNGRTHLEHRLNAYILDFYVHGQVSTLSRANCIRRGDVWYLLQDFMLTLMTVKAGLQQLLLAASKDASAKYPLESEIDNSYDLEENDQDVAINLESGEERETHESSDFKRPENISSHDWKVYKIASEVCSEFDEKFKAMWA